jgi:hypothetical protein
LNQGPWALKGLKPFKTDMGNMRKFGKLVLINGSEEYVYSAAALCSIAT